MMKHTEHLNQYLSNLAVFNIKLHNLHWNVTGINFAQVHTFTESLYNEAFENFDTIAERMKMKGEMPLTTMRAYLAQATIQEIEPKSFSTKEVLDILISDISLLKAEVLVLRQEASACDDFGTVNLLEDQISAYDKNLWFLESMVL